MRFAVATQSEPVLSSAIPRIGSRSGSANPMALLMVPEVKNASPAAVPIHNVPLESTNRQLTFAEGKLSLLV
jgi:hypothetical protein